MLDQTQFYETPAKDAPTRSVPDRPLKILFASYRSHPYVGGQGVYVREVTKALAELGHHPEVISGPPYPELDPRVPLHPLPSLDLFSHANALAAFRPSFLLEPADFAEWRRHNTGAFGEPHAFALRLAKWVTSRRGEYDVVHDNQCLAAPIRKLSRIADAPVIATIHHPITVDRDLALAAEPSFFARAFIRRWHDFTSAQASTARALPALLTVSEAAKQQSIADFRLAPSRIHVSPNGVDQEVFHPDLDVRRDPNLLVAAVSSDTPIKGLELLMRAFARLTGRFADVKLIVIGSRRQSTVQSLLPKSCHGERVQFVQGLDNTEVARYYKRAAVVVSPSRYEGFGLPIAEAMACGAAVVASNAGGLPEVVGEAGVLSPVGDPDALAGAIAGLLEDPAARRALGARAAERAQERFSWIRHAEAAVRLYAQVGAC